MSIYSLTDEAVQDLEKIFYYISDYSLEAATRFLDAFESKCEALTQFPRMGKIYENISPHLRGVLLNDYIILYRIVENDIEIIRIVSGRSNLSKITFQESEDG